MLLSVLQRNVPNLIRKTSIIARAWTTMPFAQSPCFPSNEINVQHTSIQLTRSYYKGRNGGYFGKVTRKKRPNYVAPPPKPKLPPKETPEQINERLFGMYPAYREAVESGSKTPVLDALESATSEPEMLEKAFQLARDVIPPRAGPRRNNARRRDRLKYKRIRKQHAIQRTQKVAANLRKIEKAQARRKWGEELVANAREEEKAWQAEKAARRALLMSQFNAQTSGKG